MTAHPPTVASIMLRSADPIRLAAWYRRVLGVAFDELLPEGCFGALGDMHFGILPAPVTPRPATSRLAVSYRIPAFEPTLLDLARLDVECRIEVIPPSVRIAHLRDIDGNELALIDAGDN